jgi:hypothetical protein
MPRAATSPKTATTGIAAAPRCALWFIVLAGVTFAAAPARCM